MITKILIGVAAIFVLISVFFWGRSSTHIPRSEVEKEWSQLSDDTKLKIKEFIININREAKKK